VVHFKLRWMGCAPMRRPCVSQCLWDGVNKRTANRVVWPCTKTGAVARCPNVQTPPLHTKNF
jgi:hypothetical protein